MTASTRGSRPPPVAPGCDLASLAADAERGDDRAVSLDIVLPHVVEQTTTATDELHQPTPGVMITLVNLEVLGQVRDAGGEQRDLDLGRTRVRLVKSVLGDDGLLLAH